MTRVFLGALWGAALVLSACGGSGDGPPDGPDAGPPAPVLTALCAAALDAGVPAPPVATGGVQLLVAGLEVGASPCVELTPVSDPQARPYVLTYARSEVPPGAYTLRVLPHEGAGVTYQGYGPPHLQVNGPTKVEVLFHDGPVQGDFRPEYHAYDALLLRYVREKQIPAATLAVGTGASGALLFERAIGTLDAAATQAARLDTPMRLASVTKPFTAAAVRELVARGDLTLSTRVFAYLGTQPIPGKTVDPRTADITLEHLLDHRGGWDRAVIGDTMFKGYAIAQVLGLTRHPNPEEIARYALSEPLSFTPGGASAYSNLGYMLLGLVVEKASGKPYFDAVTELVLTPAGILPGEVFVGRTLPQLRDVREPRYVDPAQCPNMYALKVSEIVPCPDGGFHLEAMVAHGGLVASARAVSRFMGTFLVDGQRRPGFGTYSAFHTGGLEGTYTIARWHPVGLDVTVLFNRGRTTVAGGWWNDFESQLDAAIVASPLRP